MLQPLTHTLTHVTDTGIQRQAKQKHGVDTGEVDRRTHAHGTFTDSSVEIAHTLCNTAHSHI